MSSEIILPLQVLTYKAVRSGAQPADVVQKIDQGQTFSAPVEWSPESPSLILPADPGSNFTALGQVELPGIGAEDDRLYGTIVPFNATVFGQEYQIDAVSVRRRVSQTGEIWHSAMRFQGGAVVITGEEAEELLEHLRG